MSVQSQIDRIEQNVANTYAVLGALGADMPAEQNSDNLSMTAGSAKAVLYSEQTLTDEQKAQARQNIGVDDAANVVYASCDTAAATAAKTATVSGNANWELKVGSVVMVYFTNTNSASNVTLNVNSTGAYPIWYNNAEYTSTGTAYTGYAKRVIEYVFNGTHWVWLGGSYDANNTYSNVALGQGYATCSTAAATAAKVGTLTSYALTKGGIVAVKFTYAVPANATLNINSKGAKNIFYRGAKITADVIGAGDIATFMYDGTQYQLLTIDREDFPVYDTFPTEAQINAMSSGSYFKTRGFYSKTDGFGSVYHVLTTKPSSGGFYIPYGNKYFSVADVNWDQRDITVEHYGIRRGNSTTTHAAENSAIMTNLLDGLGNGYALRFASGHYYFTSPWVCEAYVTIRGTAANSCVNVSDVNQGTSLWFLDLTDGQAAISIKGGVIQDIGLVGNKNTNNVVVNRKNSDTGAAESVTHVKTATTYGIYDAAGWAFTIQNVRLRNFTYGIFASKATNALISHVDVRRSEVGISILNDIKVNNVQAWDVMIGVQLRGPLASAVNIRGDSIGKHLIDCWRGKCLLSNIDGDYCVGSLIHYGDGTDQIIHLGQADLCMGRVATRSAYSRSANNFDLQNVAEADYEYCSYISIAPNTQVFGGQIEVANISANVEDIVPSNVYIHPNAVISIGKKSTVKGVIIKCDVPADADISYFNKRVIKSLSSHGHATNNSQAYYTDFDGTVIEDINFITPIGFIRSVRTITNSERTLEFSKDVNAPVIRYDEQALTESEKLQAKKNLGLDSISSLEFVASMDDCVDLSKTYVLPNGKTVATAAKVTEYYTNQIPISVSPHGGIFNGVGYKSGFLSNHQSAANDANIKETTENPWYVTGLIPVRRGDIVRFQNIRMWNPDLATSKAQTYFVFYAEDFSYVVISSVYHGSSKPSASWSPVYADEAQNELIQVKIPTVYSSNIRYMRMCVSHMDETSIITVNEEIIPPKVEYVFGDTGLRFITEEMYQKIAAL